MLSIIKKVRNKTLMYLKKKQFDKYSCYEQGTKFDCTSSCQNGSKCAENIKIGENCLIRGIITTCDNGKISIGNCCYIGGGSHIGSLNSIVIGNDVIIAGNTHIYDNNNHPTDPNERLKMTQSRDFFGEMWSWKKADHKPVIIGDNVWIGEQCAILKGVRIGKGAVVGCNSVVTHDVPEYTIVAGNPAKIVKYLPH